jgi:nucleoside-diphosphate-sugar epimerase
MELSGKKVLVTGSDGFIGSHLVELLLARGCRVKAFVYYNSFNSWGWLDTFPPEAARQIEIFSGDIRDPNGVRTAVSGCNIRGTLNVLQAARDMNVEKVLVTSTSEVYGTARYVPIDESHPFQGQSPYSATKIGADRLAESFFRSFSLPVTIVRPFNTYGPRQSARAVIPTVITQLLSGKSEIHLGNIHPTRDFVFVRDTVQGFIDIAESDRTVGEEINIATMQEISIGQIAETLIQLIYPEARIVTEAQRFRPENSEVERLLGSNRKIESLTGWKPRYTLEQGLAETVAWFRIPENLNRYKAFIYNL